MHAVRDFPIGKLIVGHREIEGMDCSVAHDVVQRVRMVRTAILLPFRHICAFLGNSEVGRAVEEATAVITGPMLFVHAAIWLQIEDEDGVLVEYGVYEGGDAAYFDIDGARFAKTTKAEFEAEYGDTIVCNASKPVNFSGIENAFRGNGWRKSDYDLLNHNCQDFATQIISLTGAQMEDAFDRIYVTTKAPPCIHHLLLKQTGDL
jgi:hypothetical protein